MTIYTYLKKDHQKVKDLIEKIESFPSGKAEEKKEIFSTLKMEILVHSKAEDKIFYNYLKNKPATKKDIPHAKKEHEEVEEMLERLSDDHLHGAAWDQLFKSMTTALLHHIEEEEGTIFADAKEELSTEEAKDMELQMKTEKEHVKNSLKNQKK